MNLQKIIIFPHYTDSLVDQKKIYNYLEKKYKVFYFDWEKILQNKQLQFIDLQESIDTFLETLAINLTEATIIAKGASSFFVFAADKKFNFKKIICLNPFSPKAIINPYTSNKDVYKNSPLHYRNLISQEYFNAGMIISNENKNNIFDNLYNYYSVYYKSINQIRAWTNDYIYINILKNKIKNFDYKKVVCIVSKMNNLICYKQTVQFYKRTKILTIQKSGFHLEYEDPLWILFLISKNIN